MLLNLHHTHCQARQPRKSNVQISKCEQSRAKLQTEASAEHTSPFCNSKKNESQDPSPPRRRKCGQFVQKKLPDLTKNMCPLSSQALRTESNHRSGISRRIQNPVLHKQHSCLNVKRRTNRTPCRSSMNPMRALNWARPKRRSRPSRAASTGQRATASTCHQAHRPRSRRDEPTAWMSSSARGLRHEPLDERSAWMS